MIPRRKLVLGLLCLSVLAPILLYTDRISLASDAPLRGGFEILKMRRSDINRELSNYVNEPVGVVLADDSSDLSRNSVGMKEELTELSDKEVRLGKTIEHKNRVLSELSNGENMPKIKSEILIEQVTRNEASKLESNMGETKPTETGTKTKNVVPISDLKVRQMKDQLIRARVYLGLSSTRSNPHYIKELRLRIRDVQRALGDSSKDSDLPKNANDKVKSMEQTLNRVKQIQEDCSSSVKKLRAMLHSSDELLRAHKKQTLFLSQLAAKTLPKGLHCLSLKLTSDYFEKREERERESEREKLENNELFHYAMFSDNVLAAHVVVNSTLTNAKHPSEHVFHIVTDKLNYAAMRMWFLSNAPPGSTIQVQNIEHFTWLNSSYSPVLKQLNSQSMIDYYFKTHRGGNTDPNLKYRNPKYLSMLNHLRFYLPEMFPMLRKIVFLDDDVVVKKDLSGLWKIDMKGKVIGVVETCGESFHRYDRYLNFSNPLIAKNFEARACGWAFGMNLFDLDEWRRQNITQIYHKWQNLNEDRTLWKLGTLPPGLITFHNKTITIDRNWHVLGLGYNPHINTRDIERAAVIHYNGNLKPWLEIGLPKYRGFWSKYVDYDQAYLRECNINP